MKTTRAQLAHRAQVHGNAIAAARTPAELVLDAHIAKRCDTCASWSDPVRHADDEMDGLCLQIKSGCFGLLRYASETCPYWSAK